MTDALFIVEIKRSAVARGKLGGPSPGKGKDLTVKAEIVGN